MTLQKRKTSSLRSSSESKKGFFLWEGWTETLSGVFVAEQPMGRCAQKLTHPKS
jgi:hypothetical protein